MAAPKRKENPSSPFHTGSTRKKPRNEEKVAERSSNIHELETATDSDPIVESDTTSQSGDDDGVSWPSEEEVDTGEALEGAGVIDDKEHGGAKIAETAVASKSGKRVQNATDTASGMAEQIHGLVSIADFLTGSTSKEAHAKQKVEKQERKAAKPNADSIARSKKLWERLRRKSHVPKDERKVLVAELFDIITGRVKDFVFKHDSVRVIQTALKYANSDQRKMIARELKGEYKTLAESKYAKFLIGKMLVHGDEETRDMVVPEFYGHVRRMIKHPEASWILDDIYRGIATSSQKATLLREWYGAEFALFKSSGTGAPSAELKKLLEDHPEKRTPIMRFLHDLVNLLVQKKTTGFTMLHDAMLQQFLNLAPGSEEATEFVELLKGDEEGDLLKNLAFTKSGARLVCLALAYGNAKDRKQILKTYKETMKTLAFDAYGHQVLLAVYDVIDDTVLISKSVISELVGKEPLSESHKQDLLQAINNLNARVTLLYPFCGKVKAILPNEDLKLLDEIQRIRSTTSKKDPELRRKELVTSLSPALLSLISSEAKALVSTSFGCQFVSEVLLGAPKGRDPAMNAVAALAKGDDETKALLNSPAAGRMLKNLVLGGRFNPTTKEIDLADPALGFHDIFYNAIKDEVLDWATGANSFVVIGLLEAPGFPYVEELKVKLSKGRQKLVEAARSSGENDDKVKSKRSKGSKSQEEAVVKTGNKGAQLLLEKIDQK